MLKVALFLSIFTVLLVDLIFQPEPDFKPNHLKAKLSIFRDQHGIAHVAGHDKADIFYGIGYAQAQDRLFGIFLKKIFTSGRMSEFFGYEGLRADRYIRNLGLKQMAETNAKIMDSETRTNLESYARGINDYARSVKILPFQFYFFYMDWEDWTIEDSHRCVGIFNFILQFDWMYEIIRQRLKQIVGYEFAMKLIPAHTGSLFQEINIIKDDELKKLGRYKQYNASNYKSIIDQHWKDLHLDFNLQMDQKPDIRYSQSGSNAWVIGGKHTASGKNILANDPHLGLLIPSSFYPIELILLDSNSEVIIQTFGVMTDGLPGFCLGVNKKFGWGSTALYADNKDLYKETMREINGSRYYLLEGEWKLLKERKQFFKVRGSTDISEIYYETHRGPIINSIFLDLHLKYGAQFADHHEDCLSLESILYTPDNQTVRGLTTMPFNTDYAQMRRSTKEIKLLNIDSVLISDEGLFSYQSIGRIPKKEVQQMGSFIKDGNTTFHSHQEYYSDEEMPQLINPQRGYVAMANNKFASDHFDLRGSLHQISNGRSARLQNIITQKIGKQEKFTIEDMINMQLDTKDIFVEQILQDLLSLFKKNQRYWQNKEFTQKIVSMLEDWNCNFDKDQIQPSIYTIWEHQFQTLLLRDKNLTEMERISITNHAFFEIYYFRLIQRLSNNSQFTEEDRLLCENQFTRKSSPNANPCIVNMIIALNKLESSLKYWFGTLKSTQWKWGTIHRKDFTMTPWSTIPLIGEIWNRRLPASGNSRTLNVGVHSFQKKSFNTFATATFRLITDLNRTLYSIDMGVSDRVLSPYYDNFAHDFNDGKYVQHKLINPFKEQSGWKEYVLKH